jgi:hypothetical protein
MRTVSEAMAHVGRVGDRFGVAALAQAAGLPESTVRSFRDRGWTLASLANCEKLIAAAKRLEAQAREERRREREERRGDRERRDHARVGD